MNKVLRLLLAIVLTPIIMIWNVITVGIVAVIGFVIGVIKGSANTIDRVIDGPKETMEVNE